MNFFVITPFILQTAMWALSWPMLWVFSSLRVIGKENLRGISKGAIFAINHLSDLDPILIPTTLGPFSPLMPVFSVSLERSFYKRPWPLRHFYGGSIFRMLGSYAAVIGTNGDYERSLKQHIRILEHGHSVGIFPEGRRNFEGKVGEGKSGVAYLLWRTGHPVIPIAVKGHFEMLPHHFIFRRHKITVSYGKLITREELFGKGADHRIAPTREELKFATHVIMSRIREMYEKI